MDPWQRRIERAAELARRYPVSAELMYLYRDIARFRSTIGSQDPAPLRAFIAAAPSDPLARFFSRVLAVPNSPHPGPCAPLAAVWRGAARSLLCATCLTEVLAPPDACPACSHATLRTYSDPEFDHLRIEACDACRSYLKAVDLARDPDAVPEVDDLASVPLDLWAAANGYRRIFPNLFGL